MEITPPDPFLSSCPYLSVLVFPACCQGGAGPFLPIALRLFWVGRRLDETLYTLFRCPALAPPSFTNHSTTSRLPPELAQRSAVDPCCRQDTIRQDKGKQVSGQAGKQARPKINHTARVWEREYVLSIDPRPSFFFSTEKRQKKKRERRRTERRVCLRATLPCSCSFSLLSVSFQVAPGYDEHCV